MTIEDIQAIINIIINNPFFVKFGLPGLFVNGVLASTAVPFPTELTVSALLAQGHGKLELLLVLAPASILGGVIMYYIGKSGNKLFHFLKGKHKPEDEEKGHGYLRKYGWIAIAGSAWIPFVGDLIPLVAGTKKYDFRTFIIALSIGKVTRTIGVIYFSSFLVGTLLG
jgi:membrane protein YqaA with SNARE-associated domain